MLFFAYDENKKIVFIEKAIKKKDYYCPNCGSVVRVKQGTKKRKHFFHLNLSDCGYSAGESIIHKYFKEHITDFITDVYVSEKVFVKDTRIDLIRELDSIKDGLPQFIIREVRKEWIKQGIKNAMKEKEFDTNIKGKTYKVSYNEMISIPTPETTYIKKQLGKISLFEVEKRLKTTIGDITPDVLVTLEDGSKCAIEIYYKNKKSYEHIEKYKKLNMYAIEVKIDEKCNIVNTETLYNPNDVDLEHYISSHTTSDGDRIRNEIERCIENENFNELLEYINYKTGAEYINSYLLELFAQNVLENDKRINNDIFKKDIDKFVNDIFDYMKLLYKNHFKKLINFDYSSQEKEVLKTIIRQYYLTQKTMIRQYYLTRKGDKNEF